MKHNYEAENYLTKSLIQREKQLFYLGIINGILYFVANLYVSFINFTDMSGKLRTGSMIINDISSVIPSSNSNDSELLNGIL